MPDINTTLALGGIFSSQKERNRLKLECEKQTVSRKVLRHDNRTFGIKQCTLGTFTQVLFMSANLKYLYFTYLLYIFSFHGTCLHFKRVILNFFFTKSRLKKGSSNITFVFLLK